MQDVAMCCSVMQFDAVCCSMLQSVCCKAVDAHTRAEGCCLTFLFVVLQCVAVC